MIVLNLTRRTVKCRETAKPVKPAKVIIRRKNNAPGCPPLNAASVGGVEVRGEK